MLHIDPSKKIYQVFTHKDLDGAGSLLTFLWSNPDATVTSTAVTNIQIDNIKDYINRTCNPPNVLLMDLALRPEFLPELDQDFITFIDHHNRSEQHIDKFRATGDDRCAFYVWQGELRRHSPL